MNKTLFVVAGFSVLTKLNLSSVQLLRYAKVLLPVIWHLLAYPSSDCSTDNVCLYLGCTGSGFCGSGLDLDGSN